MARLFITPRELKFTSDIAKEFYKDVVGQYIVYYPISETTTATTFYNEALQKHFDTPIKLDAIVDAEFTEPSKQDRFSIDNQYKIEVFIHYRDMVDRGIDITIGDYFSFSSVFYEISDLTVIKNIYGMAEHKSGLKLIGYRAREGTFNSKLLGPTDISYTDPTAVQTKFEQQRGFAQNEEGVTGDKRELVESGALSPPISPPAEISKKGDPDSRGDAFYGEK